MKIDKSASNKVNVKKIAELANLSLTSQEEDELEQQLNDIVAYIEQLNSIDTTNIEPTSQVTGLINRTRNDEEILDSFFQEEALSGTEKKHNGLFVVDKLVDTT